MDFSPERESPFKSVSSMDKGALLVKNIVIDGGKVRDNYLVIHTVPFGMDGANFVEWSTVLAQNQNYRDILFKALVTDNPNGPKLVLAEGEYAEAELRRMLGHQGKVVNIKKEGLGNFSGMSGALNEIASLAGVEVAAGSVHSANIPRSHLSYYARTWEGTTRDRVITAPELGRGKIFAMVAPDWAVDQKPQVSPSTAKAIKRLKSKLYDYDLPLSDESVQEYLQRMGYVDLGIVQ